MSTQAALLRLGDSTADAVDGVLRSFGPDTVRRGGVSVREGLEQAVAGVPMPVVAADVSYVDGVTGGNVFLMPVEGARRLAAIMMSGEPDAGDADGELGELELSAIGEAMNQMMSAAALATSGVLGQEIEIAPQQIRVVEDEAQAVQMLRAAAAPHVLTTEFVVAGAPSRLVQLVPNAFVVKLGRALDELTHEYTSAPLSASLRAVPVRVWAELGRARMPAGASLGVPAGSVIELDREVDDAIDLYVDGMRFASGRLLVAEDGGLQLQIDAVAGLQDRPAPAEHPAETSIDPLVPQQPDESTEV